MSESLVRFVLYGPMDHSGDVDVIDHRYDSLRDWAKAAAMFRQDYEAMCQASR